MGGIGGKGTEAHKNEPPRVIRKGKEQQIAFAAVGKSEPTLIGLPRRFGAKKTVRPKTNPTQNQNPQTHHPPQPTPHPPPPKQKKPPPPNPPPQKKKNTPPPPPPTRAIESLSTAGAGSGNILATEGRVSEKLQAPDRRAPDACRECSLKSLRRKDQRRPVARKFRSVDRRETAPRQKLDLGRDTEPPRNQPPVAGHRRKTRAFLPAAGGSHPNRTFEKLLEKHPAQRAGQWGGSLRKTPTRERFASKANASLERKKTCFRDGKESGGTQGKGSTSISRSQTNTDVVGFTREEGPFPQLKESAWLGKAIRFAKIIISMAGGTHCMPKRGQASALLARASLRRTGKAPLLGT